MTPLRVALLLAVVCAVAGWQVTLIPESAIQMAVGPVLVPAMAAAALSVVTLVYGLSAWRGRQVDEASDPAAAPLPGLSAGLDALRRRCGPECAPAWESTAPPPTTPATCSPKPARP